MRKKRLITCIMVIAVVCMISVNAFAADSIFMGEKESLGRFIMESYLYYSGNTTHSITVYYMETIVDNSNGVGAVNYLNYKADYGLNQDNPSLAGSIDVKLTSWDDDFEPIYPGQKHTLVAPLEDNQPLGSFAKGAAFEMTVCIGDTLYPQFTRTTFPRGTQTWINK